MSVFRKIHDKSINELSKIINRNYEKKVRKKLN